ncbi:MAG: hypothetical protein AB4372_07870 [Xenococcus sp. (in: cyanobacteria)]
MKKLSLFATVGILALMGTIAPVNANPSGESLDASGENYIINPETGEKEKIDPATGAVIEDSEGVVGEGNMEVIEEDTVIVDPSEEAASEPVE